MVEPSRELLAPGEVVDPYVTALAQFDTAADYLGACQYAWTMALYKCSGDAASSIAGRAARAKVVSAITPSSAWTR